MAPPEREDRHVKGRTKSHFFSIFSLLLPLIVAVGCDKAPSPSQAREWTAADHGRGPDERDPSRAAAQAAPPPRGAPGDGGATAAGNLNTVVELTWQNQCAACHGRLGHGDGPNGPMVHAPDLTREDWQSKVSDAEIVATIRNGKNQMPRFDVSDQVAAGLAARIRASRGH